ncbi:hypothetical protein RHSP_53024 [Rhizobium freirei PRF 81]|uniref:Uncharacterized protein n=1 Tax=Rhizobium freirei PRF 81 TaxID=363754 RepID=N6UX95_9HYPH|nr:hypothetical protein RHSP_53024 [Rhizobium freirei PRF 81]
MGEFRPRHADRLRPGFSRRAYRNVLRIDNCHQQTGRGAGHRSRIPENGRRDRTGNRHRKGCHRRKRLRRPQGPSVGAAGRNHRQEPAQHTPYSDRAAEAEPHGARSGLHAGGGEADGQDRNPYQQLRLLLCGAWSRGHHHQQLLRQALSPSSRRASPFRAAFDAGVRIGQGSRRSSFHRRPGTERRAEEADPAFPEGRIRTSAVSWQCPKSSRRMLQTLHKSMTKSHNIARLSAIRHSLAQRSRWRPGKSGHQSWGKNAEIYPESSGNGASDDRACCRDRICADPFHSGRSRRADARRYGAARSDCRDAHRARPRQVDAAAIRHLGRQRAAGRFRQIDRQRRGRPAACRIALSRQRRDRRRRGFLCQPDRRSGRTDRGMAPEQLDGSGIDRNRDGAALRSHLLAWAAAAALLRPQTRLAAGFGLCLDRQQCRGRPSLSGAADHDAGHSRNGCLDPHGARFDAGSAASRLYYPCTGQGAFRKRGPLAPRLQECLRADLDDDRPHPRQPARRHCRDRDGVHHSRPGPFDGRQHFRARLSGRSGLPAVRVAFLRPGQPRRRPSLSSL